MNVKYKILLATLGLIGVYFFIRKKNSTLSNTNQSYNGSVLSGNSTQDSTSANSLIKPIKPIKPISNTNQNNNSQFIVIDGIKYQTNQGAMAQQATNAEITKGWANLEKLIKFANDPNNPTMSILDPVGANMAYDAYNLMVQQTDAYNAQTDYMQQVLDSFLSGNPLNLQGTYYQLPNGKYGFYIHSNNSGGMCPTSDYRYNETTGICELLS
jgi:hypothetical protein